MTARLPTLTKAAKIIGVSPRKLFARLRELKIIDQKNYAHQQYRANGLLVVQRGYVNNEAHRSGSYWVTVATDEGLLFLREIANAMATNGQVVVAEQHRAPDQRSASRQETDVRRVEPPHESLGYAAGAHRRNGQPGSSSTTLRG